MNTGIKVPQLFSIQALECKCWVTVYSQLFNSPLYFSDSMHSFNVQVFNIQVCLKNIGVIVLFSGAKI